MRKIFLPALLILGLFTRFYNLDQTGVFQWDQSIDLVKIHQYAVNKTLTLVGPISEDGSKVFGSLTYYMLMPFAAMGNFEPLSTTQGAVFWGFLTYLLIILMARIINKKLVLWVAILGIAWFPLVEISRSAWNPYLMPFWIALGIIFYQFKKNLSLFFSGIFLGLSIHNHYVAVFSTGVFILLASIASFKHKKFLLHLFLIFGFISTIVPFIIFDLRHPPGLFLSRIIYFNHVSTNAGLSIVSKIWENWQIILSYYTHGVFLSWLLGISVVLLFVYDLKTKNPAIIYGLAVMFQVLAVAFLSDSFIHYFLPALIFFLAYVLSKRDFLGAGISKFVFAILMISSVFTISSQLLIPTWSPSIKSIREITNILNGQIKGRDLRNVNLAVLASVDNNTYGRKYRDLLLIKDVNLLSKDEYFKTDNLFIVSQSAEEKVRNDAAVEMQLFRRGVLRGQWRVTGENWKVYLFNRNVSAL